MLNSPRGVRLAALIAPKPILALQILKKSLSSAVPSKGRPVKVTGLNKNTT